MYYDKEIKGGKKYWVVWLESFAVGEAKQADILDRAKIGTSISNNFHKTKRAKFTTNVDKNDPFVLWVKRTA